MAAIKMNMIALIFIVGCIAFYFYTKNETKEEHLERKFKILEKENNWNKLLKENESNMRGNEISDELEKKASDFVKRKSLQLGKEFTFEDVVIDSIERNGSESTKEVFSGIVNLMRTAGKDVSNSQMVFNKYFD